MKIKSMAFKRYLNLFACYVSDSAKKLRNQNKGHKPAMMKSNPSGCSLSSVPETEEHEDDSSLGEGGHVYRDREKVYSVFRQSAPQLDGVQTHLADRLVSKELFIDFKVGWIC